MSIKQQKSMASQTKMAAKQKELQKKYANNKQKYNEELMKLYEKEGVNPSSGCLVSFLPLPIMLGIYYSVIMPLSNTLHISSEAISLATDYISKIPGMVASATSGGGLYSEMEIIRNFEALKGSLTMFTPEDLEKIEFFSQGFHFFGLDLLATPWGSAFLTFFVGHPGALSGEQLRDAVLHEPQAEAPGPGPARLHEGHDVCAAPHQRVLGVHHARGRGLLLGDLLGHQLFADFGDQPVFQRGPDDRYGRGPQGRHPGAGGGLGKAAARLGAEGAGRPAGRRPPAEAGEGRQPKARASEKEKEREELR